VSPTTSSNHGAHHDTWSEWLLTRRQGGRELEAGAQAELTQYRNAVLSGAAIRPGDVVLDVGCGDGLIGFGALEAAGHDVQVIFSDISDDLLQRCRERAAGIGVSDRCAFLESRADNLAGVADRSVDVVTTRSVLIYVDQKERALAEFFRVLRPGGRLSVMEPINSRMYPEPSHLFWGWDVSAVQELRDKVVAEFERVSRTRSTAMMNFDENDLLRLAEDAGFVAVDLLLSVAVGRPKQRDWERLLHSSPNPLAPTLADAVRSSLSNGEAGRFRQALRTSVEGRVGRAQLAVAYLRATR
jgi:ubiquinone/menaquinone biosynthesis C-methylase UbiE